MIELVMMGHVFFGVVCLLLAVWVFVETLNVSRANEARIRKVSLAAAVFMWLAFLVGGYWYVADYGPDKAIIVKGPWPFAHSFFMETKEHLVIMLLMLVTYLPIAAAGKLAASNDARRLVLWVAGAVIALAFTMEGEGGIIAMGVKMGLLATK